MIMILEMVIDAESGAICDLLDSIGIHIPCVVSNCLPKATKGGMIAGGSMAELLE